MTIWTRAALALWCLLLAARVGAADQPLSLLLLPPIAGKGSPQLAISWRGDQSGMLELSALDADGRGRHLKSRTLEPGMHLDGVELAVPDVGLLAVLRDELGRELARAEQAVPQDLAATEAGPRRAVPAMTDAPQTDGGTLGWKSIFNGNTGPDEYVFATTIWDDGSGPALVVGGSFTSAGGAVANRIARWNGSSWSSLGSDGGNGLDDSVAALAVFGGDLYVGGVFTQANVGGSPVSVNRVARWNGSSWAALGSGGGNGVNNSVFTFAALNGQLYLGGNFTQTNIGGTVVNANRIASWDGSHWSSLGNGGGNGLSGSVYDMVALGGELYVAGQFAQANLGGPAITANNIARWNGSAWFSLGSGGGNGVNGSVRALAVFGGDLYLGGWFTQANVGGPALAASRVVRWNGAGWAALGSGGGNGVDSVVEAFAVMDGELYLGGHFTTANVGGAMVAANRIARWSGSSWSGLGSGGGNGVGHNYFFNASVNSLTVLDGQLYVAGLLNQANLGGPMVDAGAVVRWNGSSWSGLGSGGSTTAGTVHALAVMGQHLYVGGTFTQWGSGGSVVTARNIARWNGFTWSSLGSGGGNGVSGTVWSLAVLDGQLYVGGNFIEANVGGTVVAANRVARWNGSSWSSLGSSGGNGVNGSVLGLEVLDGELYLGGLFTQANLGGPVVAANRVARWNGSSWSALGSGEGNGVNGNVWSLAVLDGQLLAGGDFTQANIGGSVVNANRIARWNGSGWAALGSAGGNGVSETVNTMTVLNGQLYVGGAFTQANVDGPVVPANRIARWNGSHWSSLAGGGGDGVNGTVRALMAVAGELYVAGSFTQAQSGVSVIEANNVARWNGSHWSSLGTGIANGVDAVAWALAEYDGSMFVGGSFTRAGGRPSQYVGAYGIVDPTVTEILSTHPTPSRADESVRVRARVTAGTAPSAGHVTISGAPGGSCSDLTLTPIDATSAEAECTIRWNGAGAQTLTAHYVGAADWTPSSSAPVVHAVDPGTRDVRPIFRDDAATGLNGTVFATAIWDDGSGPALVVGGNFTHAGSTPLNHIARWNGERWVPLGSGGGGGVNDWVFSLAVLDGALYAGGDFTSANVGGSAVPANRIARWDGSQWSAVGSGGGNGLGSRVNALAVLNGQLYAGGNFTQANVGGTVVNANRMARWNGSGWASVGSAGGNGVDGAIEALAVLGGALYAGGVFTQANLSGTVVNANRVARWNGNSWSALGSGGGNGVNNTVNALGVADGQLYVGGGFTQTNVGGTVVNANRIARWNGSSWASLGSGGGNGVNGTVLALEVLGGELYLGGVFTQANTGGATESANYIARWNGSGWAGVGSGGGSGMNSWVFALAALDDQLYAGGDFVRANAGGTAITARHVARWNGSTWSSLGSGGDSGVNGKIWAATVMGGQLYVGGDFTEVNAGGTAVTANYIARWNGSSWSSLGSGGGNGVDFTVRALAARGGELYVGGYFTQANVGGPALTTNRIARWNGSSWSPVGSGAGNGLNASVLALEFLGEDLYAGGSFAQANVGGAVVNVSRIARWNGSTWSAVGSGGSGVNAAVHALAALNGQLYVGGGFTQANVGAAAINANRIARWSGSGWSSLGSGGGNGVNDIVWAFAVLDGQLYAGGEFTQANVGATPVTANRIARWSGGNWASLGSGGGNGVDGTVFTLAALGGELYAGGAFTQANLGGAAVTANRIARWTASGWSGLGSDANNGLSGELRVLVPMGGALYLGGEFNEAFGRRNPNIAVWGPSTETTTGVHSTSPNPSAPGQPVTLTARVSGRVAPNPGTVTFVGTPSGSCSDLALTVLDDQTSEASCIITFNVIGPQQITARYDGAALPGGFGHLSSASGALLHTVAPPLEPSTTVISNASPSPSQVGQAVAIAVITSGSSTQPTDGSVTVAATTGESCTDATPVQGSGSSVLFDCAITFNTVGPRTLTATFGGSATHAGSTSIGEAHAVVTTLTLAPVSLPGGTFGAAYNESVSASGAGSTAPYTYGVSSGALPAGLSLNPTSGAISGTPSAVGSFEFAITASDSSAPALGGPFTATRAYSMVIARANQAPLALSIDPVVIPLTRTAALSVTGGSGTGAVSFAVTAGQSNCSVSGATLTGIGVGTCTVTATKAGDGQYHPVTAQAPAEVLAAADLQVSKDDGSSYALQGGTVVYEILVTNAGPLPVQGARLRDLLPPGLGDGLWTCTPVQLASCPQAAGAGDIDQTLDLPVNAVLRYQLSAVVAAAAGSTVTNTATIEMPATIIELEPDDNTASDSNSVIVDGVFQDRFQFHPVFGKSSRFRPGQAKRAAGD